jgi:predicted GNAT family N-acyltransferase
MNKMEVVVFNKTQQRQQFDCGVFELNRYIHQQISQDAKRKIAAPFVLLNENQIVGFYTLSASSVNVGDLPTELIKKLPKYPLVPVALLGRLAIDKNYQGKGLGDFLLMDALKRSLVLSEQIGLMAIVVDAINESASHFYQQYGFEELTENRLFLPIQNLVKVFEIASGKRL